MRWWLLMCCGGCGLTVYTSPPSDDSPTESDTEVQGTESELPSATETEVETPSETESEPTESDTEEPETIWPLISEVCDHADNGNIKYVELYNPGATSVDLTGWTLDRFSNGGSTASTVSLDGVTLAPGELWVIVNASGADDFRSLYGRPADQESGNVNGNGNDVYVLSRFGAKTIDIYGDVGVDGEGEAWEYTDSVATRLSSVSAPSTTWTASEWDIQPGVGSATPFVR